MGEASADCEQEGDPGSLSTKFFGFPTEFCIPGTHPKEAVISLSLARQGTRRMGTPA